MKRDRDDARQRTEADSAHHEHGHEEQWNSPDEGQQRSNRST
jgi:hypothetical protein